MKLQRRLLGEKWLMFRASSLAWAASLFVLGGLNMTPLCAGRDNGDGTNDVFLYKRSAQAKGPVCSGWW